MDGIAQKRLQHANSHGCVLRRLAGCRRACSRFLMRPMLQLRAVGNGQVRNERGALHAGSGGAGGAHTDAVSPLQRGVMGTVTHRFGCRTIGFWLFHVSWFSCISWVVGTHRTGAMVCVLAYAFHLLLISCGVFVEGGTEV
ncbi:unnamed protein product [Ostreobium quekettii]|uniref:Uncharacterized protein n=1 Tax=Ostreobium quekettii TaxID=121088 RepID=A0A8S1JGJ5_9CHLO|nr:unnamed protein product [Ostreobium quekettii]